MFALNLFFLVLVSLYFSAGHCMEHNHSMKASLNNKNTTNNATTNYFIRQLDYAFSPLQNLNNGYHPSPNYSLNDTLCINVSSEMNYTFTHNSPPINTFSHLKAPIFNIESPLLTLADYEILTELMNNIIIQGVISGKNNNPTTADTSFFKLLPCINKNWTVFMQQQVIYIKL